MQEIVSINHSNLYQLHPLFIMLSCLISFVVAAKFRPSLIPEPNKMTLGDGYFKLDPSVTLVYDPSIPGALDVVNWAGRVLRVSTGYNFGVSTNAPSDAQTITFAKSKSQLGKEDYALHVHTNDVVIEASAYNGLFFGLATLLQLLPPEIYSKHTVKRIEWTAPVCDIEDSPRFTWRGVMLDVSRHFFDIDAVKHVIDGIALLKMNHFHWHLTDDNGWRIEIKKYPNFTLNGSRSPGGRPHPYFNDNLDNVPYGPFFYTQEEVKDVVQYAKKLGITVVPEIEMPGHSLSGVCGYPEISCLGVGPFEPLSLFTSTLEVYCPGNDKTFEILQGVLDEIMELFDSEYIHIGGDECIKTRWQSCAKCQKRIKDEGLYSVDKLQTWFVQKMADYVESKGRHIIGWDEILDTGLTQKAGIMSWRGTAGGEAAAAQGHYVVMSPGTYYYLDHNQFPGDRDVFQYNCCLKPMWNAYSYNPLEGIPESSQKYIMGIQGNMWTEYVWGGEYDAQYKIFPRASAIAEVGWTNQENKNWIRFMEASVRAMRKRYEIADIHAAPLSLGKRPLWSPQMIKTDYTTVKWEITDAVTEAGPYACVFVMTEGDNAVMVKNVQILFEDSVASHDDHEGTASWEETGDNVWTLTTTRSAGTQKVYLQADIKGVSGTESYGEAVVYFMGRA